MKSLIILCACVLGFAVAGNSQSSPNQYSDTVKVVLENEKLKVTEYTSTPGKDVCGKGEHYHPAHLTILLTDVSVQLTTAEGEVKNLHAPSGATFWSEDETHLVLNNGAKGTRVLLVEVKSIDNTQ
jgi:hypothetical protein